MFNGTTIKILNLQKVKINGGIFANDIEMQQQQQRYDQLREMNETKMKTIKYFELRSFVQNKSRKSSSFRK